MTTTLKTCFKCNIEKPLAGYYRHAQMADGHLNKCKECTKKDVAEHRESNLHQIRGYDRMRYRRDEHRQRQLRSLYLKQSEDQKKVTYLTGNAIRDGRLVRPEGCWGCGVRCKPEAHHSFYDPEHFDAVTWLCRSCHVKAHKLTQQVEAA